MRNPRILAMAVCAAFLVAFAAGAQAQNLVANPGFDHDLSGWNIRSGNASWAAQDAHGSLASGSLFVQATGEEATIVESDCFRVTPGAYSLEYSDYVAESGPYGFSAFLGWYSDASCSHLIYYSTSFGDFFHGANWRAFGTRFAGIDIVAPPETRSAAVRVAAHTKVYIDDFIVQRKSSCTPGTCLSNERFAVDVLWTARTPDGYLTTGHGQMTRPTPDSALFSFFDPANIELIVKVLNGCALNGHYWVFVAGLTDVKVEITVTDVATGATKTYVNPLGQAFLPIQDTAAFATCP